MLLYGRLLAKEPTKFTVEQTDQCQESITPVGEIGTQEHPAQPGIHLGVRHVVEQGQVGGELHETD